MLLWSGNKWIMTEVLKIKNILYLGLALLLVGCSGDDVTAENDFDPVGKPVMFSVGLEAQATTRTASTSNMASGGRFVCTMYYHSAIGDTDDSNYDLSTSLISTAWLEVSGDDGNVVYKNSTFDAAGTPFYWKNRLKHAFLAIANNNNLTSTTVQPIYNSDNNDYTNEYDLRRGGLTSIAGQPDPILALTEFKPVGNAEVPFWTTTTQEENRVTLNFKHQFSLILVNVKAVDTSVSLAAGQIEKVELLGVTTEGYVYTKLNGNGTLNPASFKEESSNNAFEMFSITPATDYVSSFNAIAFGKLCAIRVTWHEAVATTIVHTSTYTLSGTGLTLVSGKRYVYNLSLSRSGLSVINASVENWGQKAELVYDVNGTAN